MIIELYPVGHYDKQGKLINDNVMLAVRAKDIRLVICNEELHIVQVINKFTIENTENPGWILVFENSEKTIEAYNRILREWITGNGI